MTERFVREVARYLCENDDLEEYTVVEYRHFSVFRPINGKPREVPGALEYFLSDGRAVNWKSEDTFEIVATEEIITKISE